MKFVIFGNGFVGNKFAERLDVEVEKTDITDAVSVGKTLDLKRPDVVINCAGKTGRPNIDWCEDHKFETWQSNVLGPVILANECLKRDIYLVHIGSGCIYEGDKNGRGFCEDDPPNFTGSFYSRTKIVSELALKEFPVLQARLRMPVDSVPGPRNLIDKLKRYDRIISVPNSVSVISDFISAVLSLVEKRATGVFNVVNPEPVTHDQILDAYREIVDPSFEYKVMPLEDLRAVTKAGRSNCVLSTEKLESFGIFMPPAMESIRRALSEYKVLLGKG